MFIFTKQSPSLPTKVLDTCPFLPMRVTLTAHLILHYLIIRHFNTEIFLLLPLSNHKLPLIPSHSNHLVSIATEKEGISLSAIFQDQRLENTTYSFTAGSGIVR
jgi:hypothetical protein